MLMAMEKKKFQRVTTPPLFIHPPESSQRVRRCTRDSCRYPIPDTHNQCPVCGCMAISKEPLNQFTMYVEDF